AARAGTLEKLAGVALEGLAEAYALRGPRLERFAQHRAPARERHATQVVAAVVGQVEHEVHDVRARLRVERLLQPLEIRKALVVEHHDLAVEPCAAERARADLLAKALEPRAPVVAVAREEAHVVAVDARDDAVAVELELVHPAGAFRRTVDERREL